MILRPASGQRGAIGGQPWHSSRLLKLLSNGFASIKSGEPMIAKCPCDVCGENIEFSTDEFHSGSNYTCPHCQSSTVLLVSPMAKAAPKIQSEEAPPIAPNVLKPETDKVEPIKADGSIIFVINCCLFVIGFGLIFVGCGNEFHEEDLAEGSAIRQTVFAIQYCSGFILVALSLIIATLQRLAKRNDPPEH